MAKSIQDFCNESTRRSTHSAASDLRAKKTRAPTAKNLVNVALREPSPRKISSKTRRSKFYYTSSPAFYPVSPLYRISCGVCPAAGANVPAYERHEPLIISSENRLSVRNGSRSMHTNTFRRRRYVPFSCQDLGKQNWPRF